MATTSRQPILHARGDLSHPTAATSVEGRRDHAENVGQGPGVAEGTEERNLVPQV